MRRAGARSPATIAPSRRCIGAGCAIGRSGKLRKNSSACRISVLIPFPNTPLFKRLDAEGRILTRDWSKYNGKKDVVFQPALMAPRELLMGMEWAARQFYSIPSIIERLWRSRTGLWWNVVRNAGYHLALRNFGVVGFNPEHVEQHAEFQKTLDHRG